MVKVLLSSMILLTGLAVGMLKGRVYKNRERDLDDVIKSIILFKNEMTYSGELISGICRRVAEADIGKMSEFLMTTADLLENRSVRDLNEAWSLAAQKVYKKSCLKDEDVKILMELGFNLGNKTVSEHIPLFERIISLLSIQKEEAMTESSVKVRLYRILGFSASALVVIAIT